MPSPSESQGSGKNGRGNGSRIRNGLLREVNDRIREVGRDNDVSAQHLEFICECGAGDCVAMVELSAGEYDGIRSGTGVVLAGGHPQA